MNSPETERERERGNKRGNATVDDYNTVHWYASNTHTTFLNLYLEPGLYRE